LAGPFFFQVVSIIGAVLILSAYFSYQRGWMGREHRLFSTLNLTGSSLLTWVAIIDQRWGFVLLEGAWALLSIPALIRPARPAGLTRSRPGEGGHAMTPRRSRFVALRGIFRRSFATDCQSTCQMRGSLSMPNTGLGPLRGRGTRGG
jgi:hypothetical protein